MPEPVPPTPPATHANEPPQAARRASRLRILVHVLLGRRLRRRTRVILRLGIGIPLVTLVALVVLMRSPLVGYMVGRSLSKSLGCRYSAASTIISLDGRLSIEELRLTTPNLPGTASEFLAARHVEMDIDWSGLFSGTIRPTGLRLYQPLFRLSIDSQTGRMNLDDLAIPTGGAGLQQPPRILAIDGRVELGEHSVSAAGVNSTGSNYTALKSLVVSGQLTPVDPRRPIYTLKLTEALLGPTQRSPDRSGSQAQRGMVVDGRIDLLADRAEVTLHNLDLEEWPPHTVPSSVRDLWRRLDIKGKVAKSTFTYTSATGPLARIELEKVAMTALVPADRPEIAGDSALALAGVSGDITLSRAGLRANISGSIADLPCDVSLSTKGTSLDSPLRCEITTRRFLVGKSPRLLPFAPQIVRDRFANFSGPTAMVDARVLVERADPAAGAPAPFSISGSLAFDSGNAAFELFPYPLENMKGLVTFNDEKIEIVNIQGRGPTGAIISATGVIAPPTEGAGADLDIVALDVPVDDVLLHTLKPDDRRILDALFSREADAQLRRDGLVVSEKEHAGAAAELTEALARRRTEAALPTATPESLRDLDDRIARLQARADIPVFDFGGLANLAIKIGCDVGIGTPYVYSIRIDFPRTGLLPARFPLPIKAENVSLMLTREQVTLDRGRFTGLRGGTAQMAARIVLPDADHARPQAYVDVRAEEIPVDDLLINAVPDDPNHRPDSKAQSPKQMLRDLRIDGAVSASAKISPDQDGQPAVDASVSLRNLKATPRRSADGEAPAGIALHRLDGDIRITESSLSIPSITGSLVRIATEEERPAGDFSMAVRAVFAREKEHDPGSLGVNVSLSDVDLAAPLEDLVRVFTPEAAATLVEMRSTRRPEGRVDGAVNITTEAPGATTSPDSRASPAEPQVSLRIDTARKAAINALGGRVSVDRTTGPITLRPGSPLRLSFDHTTVDVAFDTIPALRLLLDGSLSLRDLAAEPLPPDDALNVTVRDARLESGMVRAVIGRAWPSPASGRPTDQIPEALAALDPRGIADADLIIRPNPAAAESSANTAQSGSPYTLSGSISPRSVAFRRGETDISLPSVTGRILLDGPRGQIESLAAASEAWRISITGSWQPDPAETGSPAAPAAAQHGITVNSTLSLAGNSLTPDLWAAFPEALRQKLERIDFRIAGPFDLVGAELSMRIPGAAAAEHEPSISRFSGLLRFQDASLDIGLPVDGARGEVLINLTNRPDLDEPFADLAIHADSLRIRMLDLTALKARVVSSDTPGRLLVPVLEADCFGGRLAATATVDRSDNGAPAYKVDALVAGAQFAPLLAALSQDVQPTEPLREQDRGRLDASISIEGRSGEPSSRRGRGSIRIAGGDVVSLPLIVPLMQLSNFQLPSGDSIDYLQAAFDLDHDTLRFDQIALMSESLSILGRGTVDWPTTKLDLRFNSKAAPAKRIPLWSDMVETLRDELLTTVVGGTLSEPSFSTESLPTTRRMLSTIVDPGSPIRIEALGEDEAAARLERERLRGAGSAATPAPPR